MKVHRFRGKRWKIVHWFPRKKGEQGDCDAPTVKGKMIRLDYRLTELQLLELAIHEALHACHWDTSEEAVGETSHDIARFLWRLGFRRGMME